VSHQDKFFDFIDDLNKNNIKYYFLRGFTKLPHKPDTDIDLVCHMSDWDFFNKIAENHLSGEGFQNFGFAEYCDMRYHPFFTPGPTDHSIPNGRFRIDSYNCLHMSSPMNNFRTYWTLPYKFGEYVFEKRIKVPYETPYYIPSVECEILLLVLRNILDFQGSWKAKHINRIRDLKGNFDQEELLNCTSMVLPHSDKVVEYVCSDQYNKIFNLVMEN
tara:strand:+ start:8730 stop:9377 length:648 start_codon:yes stop_codon:yes gene_type:complete